MKKTVIIAATVAALTAIGLSACEDGGYFDPDTKKMKSDSVSRLEAQGFDLRVYEFTPQTAPHKQCVFVAGERKAGLVCFDKKVR